MSRQDRLALSLVVEPGDARLRDLLQVHEPRQILQAVRDRRPLEDRPVPAAWSERVGDLDRRLALVTSRAESAGLRWICPGDTGWPAALDDLDHLAPLHGVTGAPLGLWVRGAGVLADLCRQSAAVVGARDCTTYGAECASEIGADLADGGWTVVSGAAFGIDGCAHRGALSMARPTVAVLACGADVDYPRAHSTLLDRIAENGLVVSEQAPGEGPMKGRFLSRNRIIAGLTLGTVVVEAALRSGSLNTLNWADQLGRTTMAVPGPVTSKQSGGTHEAVRGGRAVLVTSGREVVGELSGLGLDSTGALTLPSTEFDRLPPTARVTLDGLGWDRERSLTDLTARARLSAREVRSALELLERRGLAARRGDGWRLVRRADVS
ncbi:MAG: dprA [Aeromicrobium sp.]|nr:dprA [Aeromicrobium sp.]